MCLARILLSQPYASQKKAYNIQNQQKFEIKSASVISVNLVFCVPNLSTTGVLFKLRRCTVFTMDSNYLMNTQDALLHQKLSKTFTAIKFRQAGHYKQCEHYIKCSLHKKWLYGTDIIQ